MKSTFVSYGAEAASGRKRSGSNVAQRGGGVGQYTSEQFTGTGGQRGISSPFALTKKMFALVEKFSIVNEIKPSRLSSSMTRGKSDQCMSGTGATGAKQYAQPLTHFKYSPVGGSTVALQVSEVSLSMLV
jgi:hypothetical protein